MALKICKEASNENVQKKIIVRIKKYEDDIFKTKTIYMLKNNTKNTQQYKSNKSKSLVQGPQI